MYLYFVSYTYVTRISVPVDGGTGHDFNSANKLNISSTHKNASKSAAFLKLAKLYK